MTEQDWLASDDPAAMLVYFLDRAGYVPGLEVFSDRKLRLFACACQEAFLPTRTARYAHTKEMDGREDDFMRHGLRVIQVARLWVCLTMASGNPLLPDRNHPEDQPRKAAILREIVGNPFRPAKVFRTSTRLHPIRDGSIWTQENLLTPTVLSLAQVAYGERNADGTLGAGTLAVLSDALEEAGCMAECLMCGGEGYHDVGYVKHTVRMTHDSRRRIDCRACEKSGKLPHPILAHLRSPGPHVRGCWALDLILGKE